MPKAYGALLRNYPLVINRNVRDISKSKISVNLLQRNDPYQGPVIVKTDCNYGGLPEGQLLGPWQNVYSVAGKARDKLLSKVRPARDGVSWKRVRYFIPGTYPLFSSLQEVPEEVFANPALVIEKFLTETEGDKYLVRQNFFFGDKDFNSVLRSREPVVKRANAIQTKEGSTPPELKSFRQRLGIDYGKIDYTLRNGRAVIFDFNRTPSIQAGEFGEAAARHLAHGIWSKLDSTSGSTCLMT